jgi:flagella basal body P-ring formation protein FlgA
MLNSGQMASFRSLTQEKQKSSSTCRKTTILDLSKASGMILLESFQAMTTIRAMRVQSFMNVKKISL